MDIKGGSIDSWLVTGWFTPDYRPIAEKLAASLTEHNAPHHIWAKPTNARGWSTWAKPEVVLDTMRAYPGRTIILMDVDCIVSGDLAPLASIPGDIAITLKTRRMRLLRGLHSRLVTKTSSRVIVLRPTDGARVFAQEWQRRLRTAGYGGDEPSMLTAFLYSPGPLAFSAIDHRYAGDEVGNAVPGAIITHYGAHGRTKGSAMGNLLKSIERRWFRTGRSQAAKRAMRS